MWYCNLMGIRIWLFLLSLRFYRVKITFDREILVVRVWGGRYKIFKNVSTEVRLRFIYLVNILKYLKKETFDPSLQGFNSYLNVSRTQICFNSFSSPFQPFYWLQFQSIVFIQNLTSNSSQKVSFWNSPMIMILKLTILINSSMIFDLLIFPILE